MKIKSARRFVSRNRWGYIAGKLSPSKIKHFHRCLKVINGYKYKETSVVERINWMFQNTFGG